MRSKLMMAAAAVALIAGTSGALAQQEPQRSAPAEKMVPKASGGGLNSGPAVAPGAAQGGGATHNGSADAKKNASEESSEQSKRTGEARQNRSRSETTGQASQNERGEQSNERRENRPTDEKKVDQNRTRIEQKRSTPDRGSVRENDRTRATTGQGAAPSKGNADVNVNIAPEKRTRIHEVFVKERSAPRVDHVDFSLSVGTAVPRSVHIVAVPREIIEIEPTWRGYDYFIVGAQIVIVDPRSMEIVAILDV
jgi:hypothetical protein